MTNFGFHQHTRDEIAQFASRGHPIIVPLAATEQHGPHLPVYTDTIICDYICNQAVEKANLATPILITPTVGVGCSGHHLMFNGTISFSSATYMQMLRDIGESLVQCGFKKIIFINGHGGNDKIMHQTASDLAVTYPIWTASASYWSLSAESLKKLNAKEVGMVPGHAGGFETSLIMALRPELVRTEHIGTTHEQRPWLGSGVPGAFVGRHGELTGAEGYTDAANLANAERGRLYLETIVDDVAGWLVNLTHMMDKWEAENGE